VELQLIIRKGIKVKKKRRSEAKQLILKKPSPTRDTSGKIKIEKNF